jgi:hypothetical protein
MPEVQCKFRQKCNGSAGNSTDAIRNTSIGAGFSDVTNLTLAIGSPSGFVFSVKLQGCSGEVQASRKFYKSKILKRKTAHPV